MLATQHRARPDLLVSHVDEADATSPNIDEPNKTVQSISRTVANMSGTGAQQPERRQRSERTIAAVQAPPSAAGLPARPPRSGTSTPGSAGPAPASEDFLKGCWHCGKPNHSRMECREYIELVGGINPQTSKPYPPRNDEGKHEEHKRLTQVGVNNVQEQPEER